MIYSSTILILYIIAMPFVRVRCRLNNNILFFIFIGILLFIRYIIII